MLYSEYESDTNYQRAREVRASELVSQFAVMGDVAAGIVIKLLSK